MDVSFSGGHKVGSRLKRCLPEVNPRCVLAGGLSSRDTFRPCRLGVPVVEDLLGALDGSLHESLLHECLKAYVCILYASPCAPLLVLWPGEVEGTSLAMAQGKASPVPAPEPMFRVSAVLRRYDADVPPTAVGA